MRTTQQQKIYRLEDDSQGEKKEKGQKVKSRIKKWKNNKKIRSGRPVNNNKYNIKSQEIKETKEVQKIEIRYICQSQILSRIMELILKFAQYKPISKVGQKRKMKKNKDIVKQEENMKIYKENMEIDKKLQKQNKDLNENLKKYLISKNIVISDNIFFLRTKQRFFKFENDCLIDETQYNKFSDTNYKEAQEFINLINLIFKELSEEFINIFETIVEFYLREKIHSQKSVNQITNELLMYIRDNKESMNYILQWNDVKKFIQDFYIEYDNKNNKIEEKQDNSQPIDDFISQLLDCFEVLFQQQLNQNQQRFRQDQQIAIMIKQLTDFVQDQDDDLIQLLEKIFRFYIKQKEQNIDPDLLSGNLEIFINEDSQIGSQSNIRCLKKWELLKESTSNQNLILNLIKFFENLFINQNLIEIEDFL